MSNRSHMLIMHAYITIHHSFMYEEAQRHCAVLSAIARHLVYCIALQFVSMCWVHSHSPVCTSMRHCSSSCWRESSSKASCSLQFNVSTSRLWSPLLLLRALLPLCASVRCHARPCASVCVHAVQCAPMRLLVGPTLTLTIKSLRKKLKVISAQIGIPHHTHTP